MSEQLKIGLALGSGGARGLTHIGVLKALEEFDIKINYICGSSIGALIGAAYAVGMTPNEIEEIALQTDWKLMAKILLPSFSLSAFVNDKYLSNFLNDRFQNKTFNDCKIPFSAIATDIETGEMLIIDSGEIISAVRASISIPMLFSPVKYGKHILVDGGLSNPIPVDVVRKQNMDLIIAANLRNQYSVKTRYKNNTDNSSNEDKIEGFPFNAKIENLFKHPIHFIKKEDSKNEVSNPRFITILNQMFVITQERMSSLIIKISKPDILIEPETAEFNTLDFHKSKELIEIGYKTTISKLSDSILKTK